MFCAPHWSSRFLWCYFSLFALKKFPNVIVFLTKELAIAPDFRFEFSERVIRSSRWYFKKSCSANFAESTCFRVSFEYSCRRTACNFLKKRLRHKCVDWILWHFEEELFFQNTTRWLLLRGEMFISNIVLNKKRALILP